MAIKSAIDNRPAEETWQDFLGIINTAGPYQTGRSGRGGYVYKPVSDSTGNPVVLMPASGAPAEITLPGLGTARRQLNGKNPGSDGQPRAHYFFGQSAGPQNPFAAASGSVSAPAAYHDVNYDAYYQPIDVLGTAGAAAEMNAANLTQYGIPLANQFSEALYGQVMGALNQWSPDAQALNQFNIDGIRSGVESAEATLANGGIPEASQALLQRNFAEYNKAAGRAGGLGRTAAFMGMRDVSLAQMAQYEGIKSNYLTQGQNQVRADQNFAGQFAYDPMRTAGAVTLSPQAAVSAALDQAMKDYESQKYQDGGEESNARGQQAYQQRLNDYAAAPDPYARTLLNYSIYQEQLANQRLVNENSAYDQRSRLPLGQGGFNFPGGYQFPNPTSYPGPQGGAGTGGNNGWNKVPGISGPIINTPDWEYVNGEWYQWTGTGPPVGSPTTGGGGYGRPRGGYGGSPNEPFLSGAPGGFGGYNNGGSVYGGGLGYGGTAGGYGGLPSVVSGSPGGYGGPYSGSGTGGFGGGYGGYRQQGGITENGLRGPATIATAAALNAALPGSGAAAPLLVDGIASISESLFGDDPFTSAQIVPLNIAGASGIQARRSSEGDRYTDYRFSRNGRTYRYNSVYEAIDNYHSPNPVYLTREDRANSQ